MSVLKTHSHLDAPIAKRGAPFTVLLFNPAWKNQRTQNTFQFEDLASHGYVVASIDHTYNSQPIAFPDGRRVTAQDLPEIGDFTRFTWQQVEDLGEQELAYQVADDLYVLDALGELSRDPASDYFERLDTENSGVFGHSFGGAAAMESCRKDPRIRAAINMDGWFFGDVAHYGLAKPLFIMSDDSPIPSQEALTSSDVARRYRAKWIQRDMQYMAETFEKFGGYSMTILGSRHMVFSDRASYSPFRKLNESGGVNSRLAHQIIESYTLAFFSKYLRGEGGSLLEQIPSPYAEVEFKIYSGSSQSK
jgi:predicted dienelactone hydrolase